MILDYLVFLTNASLLIFTECTMLIKMVPCLLKVGTCSVPCNCVFSRLSQVCEDGLERFSLLGDIPNEWLFDCRVH